MIFLYSIIGLYIFYTEISENWNLVIHCHQPWLGRLTLHVGNKCFSYGWIYAMTVGKTCCQDPWLGICRDCCKHMLSRATIGYMPWLLPKHTVKSRDWVYAVTLAKTYCQDPWLSICLDCCQNMLSTALVGHVVTVAKTCYMHWLLPKQAVNSL